MHRLEPLLQVTIGDYLAQCANNIGLEFEIHGQVGILPVANDTHPLEVSTLCLDLSRSIVSTLLPKFSRGHFMTGLAHFFLDVQLDGKSVTIPSRNIGRIETR